MQRDRNLIHHQIKRHPFRRLHTHKLRSEQQRTHQLRSSQLQPRHLGLRPTLRLGKPLPIHRRQTQNAGNIPLTNTVNPLPREWILVILKIGRPVIQNPTTTPRVQPNISVNPEPLFTHPFQSCLSRLGPSLLLSPQNPLIHPVLIYPRPLNLLLLPSLSTPRIPPNISLNPEPLSTRPFQSCRSRPGPTLRLSPYNPLIQPVLSYPRPLNLLPLPSRSTPRIPPNLGVNPNPLSMHPSQSCRSRPGPALLLGPHNPLIQPLLSYPRPLNPFRRSRISILLPRGGHITLSQPLVGGGLDRRRPRLRLTRIRLRRPPFRGRIPHRHRFALLDSPNRLRHILNTMHRRRGSAPHIRRALQTRLAHPCRQLFSTLPPSLNGLQFGQTVSRGLMERDRNLIHHQIKRHPLRRLHTHKLRSEQQRTHQLRSSQLQPRHLGLRPTLRLGKPLPIHRRHIQNAGDIALSNTPFPHEWILLIRKISRPVIQNPTTTPRLQPNFFHNPYSLSTHPSQSCHSRPGPSLLLSPHNPLVQPRLIYPRLPNPLLLPSRSTPRIPPNPVINPKPLSMHPFHSCLSRPGPSLLLSPHNPLIQPRLIYPRPPNPLLLPSRSTPRIPPSTGIKPKPLSTRPFHSCRSRLSPSLLLGPHNPLLQPLLIYPRPLNLLLLPSRSTPHIPPNVAINPKPLSMQPFQSCLSRPGPSLLLSPHNPLIQPLLSYPRPPYPLRLSRISILLPRGGHITLSRPLVGGGLDRRRPRLRLTRIPLSRFPLRGPIPHRFALPDTPNRRRHILNTTCRRRGSAPHIRRALQTRLAHPCRQLFSTQQIQIASNIPLANTVGRLPRDWILVILKISRPVIQNPTTTPRLPPSPGVNPKPLSTHPFQSFPSRPGPSLLLSPHNPLIQPRLIYPRLMSLLLFPSRSTPRVQPSVGVNREPLSTHPSQSCRSRPGPSLRLSPHNPLIQPLLSYPRPLNPFRRSRTSIQLPRGGHITLSRPLVGGGLDRRRPRLRLTRIPFPRLPLGGPIPHRFALPDTPNRRRHILNTMCRRRGSAPHIRRALQTRLAHPCRQLFSTLPPSLNGLQFGQTVSRGLMERDRNLIHHQIKRHPLRRLHTHKLRSEQQRTHQLRSSQLQPRHLGLRPTLRLGKPLPIHRRQTQNAATIALTNTPFPHEWILAILKISRPVIQNPTTTPRPSPSPGVNPKPLSTHPFQSCLSRPGPSLLLSPHNPLIQPRLI